MCREKISLQDDGSSILSCSQRQPATPHAILDLMKPYRPKVFTCVNIFRKIINLLNIDVFLNILKYFKQYLNILNANKLIVTHLQYYKVLVVLSRHFSISLMTLVNSFCHLMDCYRMFNQIGICQIYLLPVMKFQVIQKKLMKHVLCRLASDDQLEVKILK